MSEQVRLAVSSTVVYLHEMICHRKCVLGCTCVWVSRMRKTYQWKGWPVSSHLPSPEDKVGTKGEWMFTGPSEGRGSGGLHETQDTGCGKAYTEQGGWALPQLWQGMQPNCCEDSSSSMVTTRGPWQKPRGGQGPVDIIIPHRDLPEHSGAEWELEFAYEPKWDTSMVTPRNTWGWGRVQQDEAMYHQVKSQVGQRWPLMLTDPRGRQWWMPDPTSIPRPFSLQHPRHEGPTTVFRAMWQKQKTIMMLLGKHFSSWYKHRPFSSVLPKGMWIWAWSSSCHHLWASATTDFWTSCYVRKIASCA